MNRVALQARPTSSTHCVSGSYSVVRAGDARALTLMGPGKRPQCGTEQTSAANATAPKTIRCHGCGSGFDEPAWRALELAETIEAEEIAHLVLNWPRHERVEVRRCKRCDRLIPARRGSVANGVPDPV
jgi:hypothetical protein